MVWFVALTLPCAVALLVASPWRRAFVVAGLPVSMLMLHGTAVLPSWGWLVLLLALLLAYPVHAWRDAPYFPSPRDALLGLARTLELPNAPRMLDAGCGLGHGLKALQCAWPAARLHGVEWSGPLAWLARRRCPGVSIERGDMWQHPWHAYDVVYLFQRPESMARAWSKAGDEMRPGTWLVSLEFTVPGVTPTVTCRLSADRAVHAWRILHDNRARGSMAATQLPGAAADKDCIAGGVRAVGP